MFAIVMYLVLSHSLHGYGPHLSSDFLDAIHQLVVRACVRQQGTGSREYYAL